MLSTELLNIHEQEIILSGCSVHQRNWQLLEHVRHLDTESLLKFSGLVQDIWPQIGLQLVTGKVQFIWYYVCMYIYDHAKMVECALAIYT